MRWREEPAAVGKCMGECIVSLRGWHPALAQAELVALFPNAEVRPLSSPRLARLACTKHAPELSISSGIEAVFLSGINIDWDDEASLMLAVRNYLDLHPHENQPCAVHAWKHGQGIVGCSRTKLAGKIGGIFTQMGATIDLENPVKSFGLLLDEHSHSITFGWLLNHGPKSDSSIERRASRRPFFKPVSLEPRLARLAVNLACGPLSSGACLDPMTGTGGFTIEAILSGRNAVAMDLDNEMLRGARKNLEWVGSQLNPFVLGDATAIKKSLPDGVETFAGVVLDPPYGRNSQGSINHHDLLQETLSSAADVVEGGLALILPTEPRSELLTRSLRDDERPTLKHYTWNQLEEMLERSGWLYQNAWYVAVHRSLGRVIVSAANVPQD